MTIGKACEGIVTFWGTDYRRQTRDVHGKVAAERKRSNSESILIAIKKWGCRQGISFMRGKQRFHIGETLVSSIGNKGFKRRKLLFQAKETVVSSRGN